LRLVVESPANKIRKQVVIAIQVDTALQLKVGQENVVERTLSVPRLAPHLWGFNVERSQSLLIYNFVCSNTLFHPSRHDHGGTSTLVRTHSTS
jgi:hypothetical protein